MKIQPINNCYNYYPFKSDSPKKNSSNNSFSYEKESVKFRQNPQTLKAYFLASNLNFKGISDYMPDDEEYSLNDFKKALDYEFKDFKEFLSQPEKIQKEDFEKLSKEKQKEYINLSYKFFDAKDNNCGYIEPKAIIEFSKDLKDYFDERYGKDNYRIISLGTSPANVAQGMEYLGSDVTYLPFSDLKEVFIYTNADTIQDLQISYKMFDNAKIALDYLKSKGITDEKDNRKIIILDYCAKGTTLYLAKQMLMEYLKDNNCSKEKINSVEMYDLFKTLNRISNAKEENKKKRKYKDNITFYHYLISNSKTKQICPVPHFSIVGYLNKGDNYIDFENKTEKEIFKEFESYSSAISKMYSICLLDAVKS